MPFSSLLFLSGFLPAFLAAYYLAPTRAKNAVALLFSIGFYLWGAPTFLPVVLFLGVLDYSLGHAVARAPTPRRKRAFVAAGIVVHLSTLAYFKYANFFVAEATQLLAALGVHHTVGWDPVVLPIGISFITFEEISYLVDVYRGDARPARSLPQYLLFLMLFPHSIAGPIFRWKDLEAQLASRNHDLDRVVAGFGRFSIGLAKKVLIANSVAVAADAAFAQQPGTLTARLAWLGAAAYTLQIYFDFSGYSDMAIGLGRMAGFTFKENFDFPYTSASITEFWTRWHISLSTWLRDYLYIPLGGNRGSARRTLLNVFVVFLLSGFWHGADWTFVVWGAYHGAWVVLERLPRVAALQARLPRLMRVALTLLVVMVGWVFFRSTSLGGALGFVGAMFGGGSAPAADAALTGQFLSHRTAAMLVLGAVIALFPAFRPDIRTGPLEATLDTRRGWLIAAGLVPVCLVLSIAYLTNSKFSPLIYFKF